MSNSFALRFLLPFLLITVVSLIFHWKVFHYELMGNHNIRQAHTQQNILNFYRHDPNIFNPRLHIIDPHTNELTILRYEFPIMQWTIAMVYLLTGESFLVSRVCMFLLGLCTIMGIYYWFRQIFEDNFTAWAGAWAFSLSPVFYYYTLNPIPDILALMGSTWSLAFFTKFWKTGMLKHAAWSAVFMCVGIFAKLPYIVFLAVPGMWVLSSIVQKKFKNLGKEIRFSALLLALVSPAVVWYAWVIPSWNNGVIAGIFDNPMTREQVMNTIQFHLCEMFPQRLLGYLSMPFILLGVGFFFIRKVWKDARFIWLAAMGFAVLLYWVYEFNMIGTIHDYYMIPFLPALYLCVAYGIHRATHLGIWAKGAVIALLLCMPVVTSNIASQYWALKQYYLEDVFLHHEDLKSAVPHDARCVMINDHSLYVFPYLIDKQGFVFWNDLLPGEWVEDMIKRFGTTYMYSESRIVDTDPEVSTHIDTLIMERGTVKVFKLKQY